VPLFSLPELKRKADALRIHDRSLFNKTASQVLLESAASFSEKNSYDVFLSHSFKDAYLILALKMELSGGILACLSFSKTFAFQGSGQRIFSARSRLCGPFHLFCFAPKHAPLPPVALNGVV